MTVVGITMVRDEQDVIDTTLRHMSHQVDALVVADNLSQDRTRGIIEAVLQEASIPSLIVDDTDPAYEQSKKMTDLAHAAHEWFGATWIVPFDADEIWESTDRLSTIAQHLHWIAAKGNDPVVEAEVYDHVATGIDVAEIRDPMQRLKWRRRSANPLSKVAVRYSENLVIEMGNHGAHYLPDQFDNLPRIPGLRVHHFPYRTPGQVISKIRNGAEAYALTDLPEHFGAHWRSWGQILENDGEEAIEALFYKWHYRQDPFSPLNIDGEIQGPLKFDPVVMR